MKTLFLIALATLIALPSQAIDVAEDELRTAGQVEFINFEGRRAERYTPDDIRDIGEFLASQLARGEASPRYSRHYTLIHVFDQAQLDRLGADIVVIERAARVNHIATIRYLLSGFLQARYRYERRDADLLATFTTYYNAVHRGDMEFFGRAYQDAVLANLGPQNAGLALSYTEWAGASRILIPLTEKALRGGPGALDTSALSDPRVVEQLQQREDRGVAERKELVELKEREVSRAEAEAADKARAAEAAKEQATRQDQELQARKEEVARQERQLQADRKTAPAEEVASREKALEASREEIAGSERAVETSREESERKQQEAAREEQKVQEKKEEIAADRAQIQRDERIVEARESPEKVVAELEKKEAELARMGQPVARNRLYYLKVNRYLSDGHYANSLFAIDALTGELLYKAPERPNIAGHQYYVLAEGPVPGVLVLTHSGDHREAHYLTLLDLDTLEPVKTGENAIFHRSFIEKRGEFFYAVNFLGEKDFRLGKYDMELRLVAESADPIDENTVFHVFGDFVYVNSPGGKVLVLSSADLSRTRELELR